MHTGIGIGSPFTAGQSQPFGLSPYGGQTMGSYQTGLAPYGSQQAILQWLQVAPQQLQQLQQSTYVQHQLLQQLLQIVPAQLQQLQQAIQYVPHQLQQLLQLVIQQQFGGQAFAGGINQLSPPQAFASPFQTLSPFTGSSGHVM